MVPYQAFIEDQDNLKRRILAIDPGETVGWSLFVGGQLAKCGQIRTTEFTRAQLLELNKMLIDTQPDVIVYESYRVYSWKTDDHAWNEVHTAQIIGIIRYQAIRGGVPYTMQTAQIAKQFVTDEKLKSWGLWEKGQKHARDSIRHGIYWMLFGSIGKTWSASGEPTKK